jgi:hypothetical protein
MFNELYQSSSLDDEQFLSAMPLSILEDGIKKQFINPLDYRKTDYVQSFIQKYNFSLDNMTEDDENEVADLHDEFIQFMKELLHEELNLGLDGIEDMPEDDQHELIHFVYRFFITNMKKNFATLIINYIDRNRDEIEPTLVKTKDVIYRNFKPELDDEYYVLILSNLSNVISHILSASFDVDSFLDYVTGKTPVIETEFLKTNTDKFIITGNFVQPYIAMVDYDFRQSLENKVRKEILNKYPNRKKEFPMDEDESETETT